MLFAKAHKGPIYETHPSAPLGDDRWVLDLHEPYFRPDARNYDHGDDRPWPCA